MNTNPCPHCDQSHPVGAQFCPATGKSITVQPTNCTQCGLELESDWVICPNCGQKLQSVAIISAQWSATRMPGVQKRWPVVVGIVALVFIIACASIYLWLGLHRRNQLAEIVPNNTAILVSVNPGPLQLLQLRNTDSLVEAGAVFATIPGVIDLGREIQENLPLDIHVDPQEDILPWVGPEISMAVFFDDDPYYGYSERNKTGSGVLAKPETAAYHGTPLMLAIATRNQRASDDFLENLRTQLEREGVEFDTYAYQEIPITEIISNEHIPLAYATFNHLVVMATNTNILHGAIDAFQGNGGHMLSEQGMYQDTMKELPGNRLGTIYLNWPAFGEELSGVSAEQIEMMPVGNLQAVESLGVGFSLDKDGLLFDYAVMYDLNDLSPAQIESFHQEGNPNRLSKIVPSDSLAYVSGQDLSLVWRAFQESRFWQEIQSVQEEIMLELGGSPPRGEPDFIEEFERETGIHLTRDLFDNMQAEYAWVVAPDTNSLWGEEIPVGLLFYAKVEGQERVEESLRDLATAIIEDEDLYLYQDKFNDIDVWLLEDDRGQGGIGFGFIGDTLFIGSSRHMLRIAAQAVSNPLSQSQSFQLAAAPLSRSRGMVYFNVQDAIRIYYQLMSSREKESFNREMRPYIQSIEAISMTTGNMDKDGWLRGALFVHTNDNPGSTAFISLEESTAAEDEVVVVKNEIAEEPVEERVTSTPALGEEILGIWRGTVRVQTFNGMEDRTMEYDFLPNNTLIIRSELIPAGLPAEYEFDGTTLTVVSDGMGGGKIRTDYKVVIEGDTLTIGWDTFYRVR